jgi:hypothetical protein
MSILTYAQIYLGIGIFFSLLMDLMHYNIRNVVDEETYEKNRYTNTERVVMVLLWPTVIYTLVVTLFTRTTVQDLEKKVEDRKKELDELKEDDKSE